MRTLFSRLPASRFTMALGVMGLMGVAPQPARALPQSAVLSGEIEDDATARKLGNVDITATRIDGTERGSLATLSDAIGRYALKVARPGTYRITFRRLGYVPLTIERVVVAADTTLPVVRMARTAQQLNAMAIADSISGIAGIVGVAKTYQPVQKALVEIAGTRTRLSTDSTGRFFVPMEKPGTYAVRVTHPTLGTSIQNALVERKNIVELAILLDSAAPHVPDMFWQDLNQRQAWRRMTSATVSGADLLRYGGTTSNALRLSPAVTQSGMRIGTTVCVFVNGLPKPGWTLDAIAPESIAFMEVYGATGDGSGILAKLWPKSMPCAGLPGLQSRPSAELIRYIVIWTR